MSFQARVLSNLFAVASCATVVQFTAVHAADLTRYISITGDNANLCTLAAPCRTLQRGIDVTPVRGELRVLDTGDYGTSATVNKSLTIAGNGKTVFLGAPLTIDSAGAVVALRSLTLSGQGTIATGVQITNASVVHIEQCLIHGFTGSGINANAAGLKLFVTDSTARDNGLYGLFIQADASRLTIDNSRFENNRQGLVIFSGRAAISRSILTGNIWGIQVQDASVSVTSTVAAQNAASGLGSSVGFLVSNFGVMTLESSHANGNDNGLFVGQNGLGRISNSTFTANSNGVFVDSPFGAAVESRRNNTIRGNTDNAVGPLTTIAAQ